MYFQETVASLEEMELVKDMENMSLLNSVDSQANKPLLKATELEVGKYYSGETITMVKTKHGDAFMVKSDEFNMYLPQRYTHVAIKPYVKNRVFCIKDFYGSGSTRTPIFLFDLKYE
jgi:hypothetical protein